MEKKEYQKYIQNGHFKHLIVVTDKFHILMCGFGKYCDKCKNPFIPQPYYGENYPNTPHYPTETICGFCVYDMDSNQHSKLLDKTSKLDMICEICKKRIKKKSWNMTRIKRLCPSCFEKNEDKIQEDLKLLFKDKIIPKVNFSSQYPHNQLLYTKDPIKFQEKLKRIQEVK